MNWARFFNMGGYAFYVWGSFGVALALMAAEVLLLRRRRKRLLRPLKQADKVNHWKEHETTT
ncbi:MAG TPA: heme exporter protein CcmD [Pyrinomonadaceae bacterium]|jgi:heme exporter protein D